MTPLPVIVLSGFLGAGKTTLLNRLLNSRRADRKLGVVVNDFGRLNVDRRLIEAGGVPIHELTSGCLCCSLQQGLVDAVRALAERTDVDAIVIEASGISVLSALLHVLDVPELSGRIRVTRVVALVDARRYLPVLHALPVIQDQIAQANLIVLNHCDQATTEAVEAAKLRLGREHPGAPVVTTIQADVPGELLWADVFPAPLPEHHQHHHEHWHAYEVVVPAQMGSEDLLALVNRLPAAVERVKGFISHRGAACVLQKVGPFPATLAPQQKAPPGDDCGRLVMLAREPIDLAGIFTGNRGFRIVATEE